MLATYRDTEPALGPVLAELIHEPTTSRLDLGGLVGEDVGRQLAAITGAPVPPELAARVHARTGGNPYFVAELGRVLGSPNIPDIPASVRDAIIRRMDRLSPQCRHQLRAASITGREFSVAVVAAMIGRPVLSCLDPLDEAVAADLIKDPQRGPRPRAADAVGAGGCTKCPVSSPSMSTPASPDDGFEVVVGDDGTLTVTAAELTRHGMRPGSHVRLIPEQHHPRPRRLVGALTDTVPAAAVEQLIRGLDESKAERAAHYTETARYA